MNRPAGRIHQASRHEDQQILLLAIVAFRAEQPAQHRDVAQDRNLILDGGHFFADQTAHDHRLAVPNHDGCRDITAGKHRHGHVEEIEVAAADRDAGTVLDPVHQFGHFRRHDQVNGIAVRTNGRGHVQDDAGFACLEGAGGHDWRHGDVAVGVHGGLRQIEFSRVNDFAHDLNLGVDTAAGGHARCGQQVRAPVLGEGLQHHGHFRIGQHAGGAQDAAEGGLPRRTGNRRSWRSQIGINAVIKEPVALCQAVLVGIDLHPLAGTIVLGGELIIIVQNPLQAEFLQIILVHLNEPGFDFHLVRHHVEPLENLLKGFEVVGRVGDDQLADGGVIGHGSARGELHPGFFEEFLDVRLGGRAAVTHGHKFRALAIIAGALAFKYNIHERRLNGIHAGDDVADGGIHRSNDNGGVLHAVLETGDFGDVLNGVQHADTAQVKRHIADSGRATGGRHGHVKITSAKTPLIRRRGRSCRGRGRTAATRTEVQDDVDAFFFRIGRHTGIHQEADHIIDVGLTELNGWDDDFLHLFLQTLGSRLSIHTGIFAGLIELSHFQPGRRAPTAPHIGHHFLHPGMALIGGQFELVFFELAEVAHGALVIRIQLQDLFKSRFGAIIILKHVPLAGFVIQLADIRLLLESCRLFGRQLGTGNFGFDLVELLG